MSINNVEDLFLDKLRDMHDAERRILRALPKMAKAASSEELASAFAEHQQQTEVHVERLDQIFETLGKPSTRKGCRGMMGILEEGEEAMNQDAPEPVLDAALIASAQAVEHYEIAGYGCLRSWADLLGQDEVSRLLQQTLDEEKETDEKLNQLAEPINAQAMEEAGQEPQEGEEVGASRRSSSGTRSSGTRSGNGGGSRSGGSGRSGSRSGRSSSR
jgi:ferritin-like metal-binding protein YciE